VDEYLDKSYIDTKSPYAVSDATKVSPKYNSIIPDKNAGKSRSEIAFLDVVQSRTARGDLQGVLDLSFFVLGNRDNPKDRSNAVEAAKLLNDLSIRNILSAEQKITVSSIFEDIINKSKSCAGEECLLMEQAALGLAINKNAAMDSNIFVFDVEKRTQFTPTPNSVKAQLMRTYLVKNLNQNVSGNTELAEVMLKSIAFVGGLDEYSKTLKELVTNSKAAERGLFEGYLSDKWQNVNDSIGRAKQNRYEIANYKIIEKAFDLLGNAGAQAKPIYADYTVNDYPLVARVQGAIGYRRLATGEKQIKEVNDLLRNYYCRQDLMQEENEEYLALRRKIVYAYYNGQKDPGYITRPGDTTCFVIYENDLDPNRLATQYTKAAVFEAITWLAPEIMAPALAAKIGSIAEKLKGLKGLIKGGEAIGKETEAVKATTEAVNSANKTAKGIKEADLGTDLSKGLETTDKGISEGSTAGKNGEAVIDRTSAPKLNDGANKINPDELKYIPETKPVVTVDNTAQVLEDATAKEKEVARQLNNAKIRKQRIEDNLASGKKLSPRGKEELDALNNDIPYLERLQKEKQANLKVAQSNIDKLNAQSAIAEDKTILSAGGNIAAGNNAVSRNADKTSFAKYNNYGKEQLQTANESLSRTLRGLSAERERTAQSIEQTQSQIVDLETKKPANWQREASGLKKSLESDVKYYEELQKSYNDTLYESNYVGDMLAKAKTTKGLSLTQKSKEFFPDDPEKAFAAADKDIQQLIASGDFRKAYETQQSLIENLLNNKKLSMAQRENLAYYSNNIVDRKGLTAYFNDEDILLVNQRNINSAVKNNPVAFYANGSGLTNEDSAAQWFYETSLEHLVIPVGDPEKGFTLGELTQAIKGTPHLGDNPVIFSNKHGFCDASGCHIGTINTKEDITIAQFTQAVKKGIEGKASGATIVYTDCYAGAAADEFIKLPLSQTQGITLITFAPRNGVNSISNNMGFNGNPVEMLLNKIHSDRFITATYTHNGKQIVPLEEAVKQVRKLKKDYMGISPKQMQSELKGLDRVFNVKTGGYAVYLPRTIKTRGSGDLILITKNVEDIGNVDKRFTYIEIPKHISSYVADVMVSLL